MAVGNLYQQKLKLIIGADLNHTFALIRATVAGSSDYLSRKLGSD